jgi:hypothetical protein
MPNEAQFQRNPDFIFRKIADELVLVPIRQDVANMDSIYTLNSVGAFIWEHLARPSTQADIQLVVLGEYEADQETLMADLARFLGEMTAIGAVREI